jgi:glutaredoxin
MIIFATIDGCVFCEKAKQHLAQEIKEGAVKMVDASEAKEYGLNGGGFPQFKSMLTNKTSMGFKDKAKLMNDLGYEGKEEITSNKEGVKFYHMEGCGFCRKAMDMLKELIDQGKIEVVSHNNAPQDVKGFPHFEGPEGTHTGLPESPEKLMNKITGSVEKFVPQYREYFKHTGNTPGI